MANAKAMEAEDTARSDDLKERPPKRNIEGNDAMGDSCLDSTTNSYRVPLRVEPCKSKTRRFPSHPSVI